MKEVWFNGVRFVKDSAIIPFQGINTIKIKPVQGVVQIN